MQAANNNVTAEGGTLRIANLVKILRGLGVELSAFGFT